MTDKGKNWKKAVSDVALLTRDSRPPIEGPVKVAMRFFYETRRNDLDGALKPTLDALAPYAIKNDRQVVELHLLKGLDRTRPRVEIEVVAVV